MQKLRRTIDEVQWGDKTFYQPGEGLGDPEAGYSERRRVLLYVLATLPDEDYEKLCGLQYEVFLWIPPLCGYGFIRPIPPLEEEDKIMKLVYLSPELEALNEKIVLAVIAHELAHLVLDHKLWGSFELDEKQEKEAWDQVRKWGFEEEIKANHKHRKELEDKGFIPRF